MLFRSAAHCSERGVFKSVQRGQGQDSSSAMEGRFMVDVLDTKGEDGGVVSFGMELVRRADGGRLGLYGDWLLLPGV